MKKSLADAYKAKKNAGSGQTGASTGGIGSGIGGAGTGGAATGGASTGGAGTVTLTINQGAGKGGGKKSAPTNIHISNVGGTTDAGNVASGDGPGAPGEPPEKEDMVSRIMKKRSAGK